MQSKKSYREQANIDNNGKVKFSYLKKKGKHKRAKIDTSNK